MHAPLRWLVNICQHGRPTGPSMWTEGRVVAPWPRGRSFRTCQIFSVDVIFGWVLFHFGGVSKIPTQWLVPGSVLPATHINNLRDLLLVAWFNQWTTWRPTVWLDHLSHLFLHRCQVSLMSGTNVWLKLRESPDLLVEPYLLAPYSEASLNSAKGVKDLHVWRLPYAVCQMHSSSTWLNY